MKTSINIYNLSEYKTGFKMNKFGLYEVYRGSGVPGKYHGKFNYLFNRNQNKLTTYMLNIAIKQK